MAFPDDPEDLVVGFAFGHSAAEDPTTLTYEPVTPASALGSVVITRGRVGDAATTEPTKIETELDDPDGEFSPRNATGTRYGQLRNGTPMEVTVDVGSGPVVRGRAASNDWNPRWTGPDITDRVKIEGKGVLSRLGRNLVSVSPLQRFVEHNRSVVLGYWPLDDPVSSTAGRAVVGSQPMAVDTSKEVIDGFGRVSAIRPIWNGVELAPWLGTGVEMERFGTDAEEDSPRLTAFVDSTGLEEEWAVDIVYRGNASGSWPGMQLGSGPSGGPILSFASAGPDITDVIVDMWDPTTFAVYDSFGPFAAEDAYHNDQLHHIRGYATTIGGLFSFQLYLDGVLLGSGTSATLSMVQLKYIALLIPDLGRPGDKDIVGHVIAWGGPAGSIPSVSDTYDQVRGALGELAGDRVTRLCTDEGVPFDVAAGDTEAMGPQKDNNLLALLRECEDADEGTLVERLDGRVGFDPRVNRYNVDPDLELTYEQITDLVPFDDDRDLYNKITVSDADNVNQATAELTTGPVGTSELTGVGPRPLPQTRNLETAALLEDHANYLLNRGTINEPRYVVLLDLMTNPDLVTAWLACDIGSRITISGAPSKHVGHDMLDLILEGYVETLSAVQWDVELHLEPYAPYRIGESAGPVADADGGRASGDPKAAIRTAIDADDLTIDFDPNPDRWATRLVYDPFSPRTASNGLGTPPLGPAYTLDEGSASNLSVSGGLGIMNHPAAGTNLSVRQNLGTPEQWARLLFRLPALPVGPGSSSLFVIRPRWTDAQNHYEVRVTTDTSGNMVLVMRNRVLNVAAQLATGVTLSHNASHQFGLAISCKGSRILAKFWDNTTGSEPDWQINVVNSQLATGNQIVLLTVAPSITNTPYAFHLDEFAVSGGQGQPDDFDPEPQVRFGGEVATVTGISSTAGSHLTAAGHTSADNAAVTPGIPGTAAAKDLMLCFSAIRSTTARLSINQGFVRLPIFDESDNVQVFGKVHTGTESNPTVTPSGGVSGDVVTAQIAVFRNMPITLADLGDIVLARARLANAASATAAAYSPLDVPVDGCVVLAFMWRQDDHSGIATLPGGFTEIDDPTTPTGNDQGLAWDYLIQTAKAPIPGGSFTVSGSGSAISKTAVVALAAGYQTMTLSSRSDNDVVKSHAAGTPIEVENALRLAL